MMMLSWDERGTLVPFSSEEELEQLLDRVRDEAVQHGTPIVATVLDAEDLDGPALSVGCGGSLSVAVWRTPDETTSLLSLGEQPEGEPAEFLFCGESTKYPSTALISNEVAWEAVRTFAAKGSQPEVLSWQQP